MSPILAFVIFVFPAIVMLGVAFTFEEEDPALGIILTMCAFIPFLNIAAILTLAIYTILQR